MVVHLLTGLENEEKKGRNPGKDRCVIFDPDVHGNRRPGPASTKGRYRPGERALAEIRHYQGRGGLLLPKLSVARLVQLTAEESQTVHRVQE